MTAPSKNITQPLTKESFKLLEDETRRRIIFLLRENELPAKEIASALKLTTQNIYHHLKKLQAGGIVGVSVERLRGHLMERFYITTADTFFYTEDRIEENQIQSFNDVLNGLNEMGIDVNVEEDIAHELSDLHERRERLMNMQSVSHDLCSNCSFSGYFMKFGPMNPLLLNRILQYYSMIKMTGEEFEEYIDETRKLRRFLLSIVRSSQ
jgi:DNA-binding transcriptional ArsR family regulator